MDNEKIKTLKKQIILITKCKDAIKKIKVFLTSYKYQLTNSERQVIQETIEIMEKYNKNCEIEALNTGESFDVG